MPNTTTTPRPRTSTDHGPIAKRRGRAGKRSGVVRDRPATDEAKLDHDGGRYVPGLALRQFGIVESDGPETVRMRKYATGTHVLLEEIGVETEATPREVVWSNNKARLYRYRSAEAGDGNRREVPILLVYGFVLKSYILDLVRGNSLVESLVQEGFDVYLLDFGISGPEDSALSLEDLVLDYLPGAVQAVLETSGAAEITLFGQSQGGTLCAMYAALFPDGPLENLVLLSAPTDFAPRNPGPFGLLDPCDPQQRGVLRPGDRAASSRQPADGPRQPVHQLRGRSAGHRRDRRRLALRPPPRPLRHGIAQRPRVGRAGCRHAFVAGGEQVGRRRSTLPR
jgi:pimeloyl-ACP methyl ester carboxylesterase